ncbi:hypothetical protein KM759_gp033 [Lymphocystis disease virus 4]|uniref:Uncharacterized protein n=1 Tax=Lymphocystis disease virus 4 TaxID=2704413 RepID=A0A6B9XHQ3_9VIRU|nr:hypothetical protein KM759_gp033 [Lymphocystis disease virus 4]QHR78566.1 hypothetical protein [Lymphocystis disease virus 4]
MLRNNMAIFFFLSLNKMRIKQFSYAAVTVAAIIAAIVLLSQNSDRWKGLLTGAVLGLSSVSLLMTTVYTNS